jgi:alkylation response protein AidB-like acyl-CoA dehydrogenase
MRGGSRFNEVFLTNVRIPDSHRIGAVNDGWRVSLITLMNERVAVSGTTQINWSHFMRAARDIPGMMQDRALREKLADWYVQAEGVNHVRARTITALSKGQAPGPEGSVAKLALYAYIHDMSSEALDMMDQYGIIDDPALSPQRGELQTSFMHVVGNRIAGGTDEIMRNIIAERVLGLPGDVRVDKDVPFADIPTGA